MSWGDSAQKAAIVTFQVGDVVRIVTRPRKLWEVLTVCNTSDGYLYLREQGWTMPETSPGHCSHYTTVNPRLCQRVISVSEGETSTKGT